MRRVAWWLLLPFVFAIPWEYSLDFGPPFGNAARLAGLLVLLMLMPAMIQTGRMRAFGAQQWLVLALLVWWCCTALWSIEPRATAANLPGLVQELMVVWLVWELADTADGLRSLLRAYMAGAWLLAALTIGNLALHGAVGQARFVAEGQDPNDVARYLDLGLPMAALLFECEAGWLARALAGLYLPLGGLAVLLTASRGGFVAGLVALAGCALLMLGGRPRRCLGVLVAMPAIAVALRFAVPVQTWARIASLADQAQGGDLNQRVGIWAAGWQALAGRPFFGTGAGTFTAATGLASIDTAHNTALSLAAEGGAVALMLAMAIASISLRLSLLPRGALRMALGTEWMILLVTSLTATIERSRSTWFVLAWISLAGRLSVDDPESMRHLFTARKPSPAVAARAPVQSEA